MRCKRVLGTRPGYVQGLGRGVLAPPSSSTGLHNNQRVEELTTTSSEVSSTVAADGSSDGGLEIANGGSSGGLDGRSKTTNGDSMDDLRSWQKNTEAVMQSIMAQKRGTPPW
ncbi:hypothetical protein MRB53_013964 [Persea americana]|uniref:Uncharacterized protein n=1 Tax=Persea americana TaxID=3435 RepID=A0ACC2K9P5_PERAE|nr:hypothetical protein MRB53_013964 [Persea americana]